MVDFVDPFENGPVAPAVKKPEKPSGELPAEVTRIWDDGHGGLERAKLLIELWGLETFLGSAIHQQAILENQRPRAAKIPGDPKHPKEKKR